MKRILLSASVFLFSLFGLSALDNPIEKYLSVRVTPQFEIANGAIKEYVFDSSCKNTDNKLSELDWNLKTIALFNLDTDFTVMKYGYLGLSATFGVPQRSDFMQDSDWLNSVTKQWLDDEPTERTNFSEHINHLDKFIDFKVRAGGNIYLPLEITLTPFLSYKYEFIRFSASGGYSEYKNYKKGIDKKTFEDKVISYEQEQNSLFLGTNLTVKSIPRTFINLSFEISPKVTTLTAIDYHYINNGKYGTAYRDSFSKLLEIESNMTAQYCFSKNHSAGINYRLQYIPLSKGDTSSKTIDRNGKFLTDNWIEIGTNTGGTERFIWALGLNYSFSL